MECPQSDPALCSGCALIVRIRVLEIGSSNRMVGALCDDGLEVAKTLTTVAGLDFDNA